LYGAYDKRTEKTKVKYILSRISLTILILLCSQGLSEAAGRAEKIAQQGNLFYTLKRFDKAIQKYDEALSETSDSEIESLIYYNKGTALYKKFEFAEAADAFVKAMATDNSRLEAKASFNTGNCKYRLSEDYMNRDIDYSIELCKEALYYYHWTIDSGVRIRNAVYNYEFAKKKLDYLLVKKSLEEKERLKQAQRYPKKRKKSDKKPDSEDRVLRRPHEEKKRQKERKRRDQQEQQQKLDQQQKRESQNLKDQHKREQDNLKQDQQNKRENLDKEFDRKQQELKQQRRGEDLKRDLDKLNQQKEERQQQLDKDLKQKQDQLNNQQQEEEQKMDKQNKRESQQLEDQHKKQQLDKDLPSGTRRLPGGMQRPFGKPDDRKGIEDGLKKSLDSSTPMDYTSTDPKGPLKAAQPEPLSKKEAKRLLDAYGRESRSTTRKRRPSEEPSLLEYKDW